MPEIFDPMTVFYFGLVGGFAVGLLVLGSRRA